MQRGASRRASALQSRNSTRVLARSGLLGTGDDDADPDAPAPEDDSQQSQSQQLVEARRSGTKRKRGGADAGIGTSASASAGASAAPVEAVKKKMKPGTPGWCDKFPGLAIVVIDCLEAACKKDDTTPLGGAMQKNWVNVASACRLEARKQNKKAEKEGEPPPYPEDVIEHSLSSSSIKTYHKRMASRTGLHERVNAADDLLIPRHKQVAARIAEVGGADDMGALPPSDAPRPGVGAVSGASPGYAVPAGLVLLGRSPWAPDADAAKEEEVRVVSPPPPGRLVADIPPGPLRLAGPFADGLSGAKASVTKAGSSFIESLTNVFNGLSSMGGSSVGGSAANSGTLTEKVHEVDALAELVAEVNTSWAKLTSSEPGADADEATVQKFKLDVFVVLAKAKLVREDFQEMLPPSLRERLGKERAPASVAVGRAMVVDEETRVRQVPAPVRGRGGRGGTVGRAASHVLRRAGQVASRPQSDSE